MIKTREDGLECEKYFLKAISLNDKNCDAHSGYGMLLEGGEFQMYNLKKQWNIMNLHVVLKMTQMQQHLVKIMQQVVETCRNQRRTWKRIILCWKSNLIQTTQWSWSQYKL